jgi:hypothetical protein
VKLNENKQQSTVKLTNHLPQPKGYNQQSMMAGMMTSWFQGWRRQEGRG